MKRIIVLIVFSTFTTAGAFAQFTSVHYGIQAGTNLFKIDGGSFDGKLNFGYSGGVYAELGLKGRWGLEPNLLVNEVVARTSPQFNNLLSGVSFQNVVLNYISLPILVTYKASDAWTFLLGPQYGYLFYQTTGLRGPTDNRDAFQKNDFSIIFGTELSAGRKLKLGARYSIGITQLNAIDDNLDSWKTHGLQVYAGFRLK